MENPFLFLYFVRINCGRLLSASKTPLILIDGKPQKETENRRTNPAQSNVCQRQYRANRL